MLKRFKKRIIWGAFVLCFVPIRSISAQEETKAAKKPQSIEVQIEVTDKKDGSPIDNVQVLVKWGEGQSDNEKAITNQMGIAKVKAVPRGMVTIRLMANGYKPVAPPFDLKTEKQPIKIKLEKEQPPTG